MTYVILPGRAAMIEYDGFHLNICNDNIWTLRTSNYRAHTTLTFLLCLPPTRLSSSQLLPVPLSCTCGGGQQRWLWWLWGEQPEEQSVHTWPCRRIGHQEHPTPGTGVISFLCYLLLTINYLWNQMHWVSQKPSFLLTQDYSTKYIERITSYNKKEIRK